MNHDLSNKINDKNAFRYTIARSVQIVLNNQEEIEHAVNQHMKFIVDDFRRENGTLGDIHVITHRIDRTIEQCTIEYLTKILVESANLMLKFKVDDTKRVLDVRIESDINSSKVSSNDPFLTYRKIQCNSVHNSNRDVLTAIVRNDANSRNRIESVTAFNQISPKKIDNSHMIFCHYDAVIATDVLFGHVMNYGTVAIQHSTNTVHEPEEHACKQAALVNAVDKIDSDFEVYIDKLIQYRSFDFVQNTPRTVALLMQNIKGLLIFSKRIDSIMPRYIDRLMHKVRLEDDVTKVIDDLIVQLCMPVRVIGVQSYEHAEDKSVMLYDELDSDTGHTTVECYTKDQLDGNDFLPRYVAAGIVAISEGYGSAIENVDTTTLEHDVNILTVPMRSWNTFLVNFYEHTNSNSL